MHSYQHNIKTFNNATRHLTRVERSLYRDLIELYYDSEKPLPADNFDRLARLVLAHNDEEKSALRYVLGEFFIESNGFYAHDYCDVQIEKFYSNTTAKALAGKASAKARLEKQEQRKRERESQKQSDVEQNPTDAQQIPTNHKTSNHNKPVTNLKDNAPQADAGLFAGLDDSTTDKQKKEVAQKFRPESLADQMPSPLCDWWLKWVDYRRERKLSTKEQTWRAQAANLDEWGKAGLDPSEAIKSSIDNGYAGLFKPKPQWGSKPLNGGGAKLNFTPTDYENGINPDGSF